MPDYISKKDKEFVKERAQYTCEYCISQLLFSPDPFSIEHIIPTSKNGSNDLDNLALSCQGCNNRKYTHIQAIDPITGQMSNLYHPRKDNWNEHFKWNEDCSSIIGLTPKGRATIKRLDLNREGLVNLRKALYAYKTHPPY